MMNTKGVLSWQQMHCACRLQFEDYARSQDRVDQELIPTGNWNIGYIEVCGAQLPQFRRVSLLLEKKSARQSNTKIVTEYY